MAKIWQNCKCQIAFRETDVSKTSLLEVKITATTAGIFEKRGLLFNAINIYYKLINVPCNYSLTIFMLTKILIHAPFSSLKSPVFVAWRSLSEWPSRTLAVLLSAMRPWIGQWGHVLGLGSRYLSLLKAQQRKQSTLNPVADWGSHRCCVHVLSAPPAATEPWFPGLPACGWSPAAAPPGGAATLLRSEWTGSQLLT